MADTSQPNFSELPFLQHMPNGFVWMKLRMAVWANPSFYSMFGYTAEDLRNKSTDFLYKNPGDYDFFVRNSYHRLKQGDALDLDAPIKCKDGAIKWCRIVAYPLDINSPEQGFILNFIDIDKTLPMIHAFNKVQDDLARHEALLRSLHMGVLLAVDNKITWCNERLCEILGYTEEQLIKADTSIFYQSPESYQQAAELFHPKLEAGVGVSGDMELKRGDSSLIWCNLSASPVDVNDPVKGYIWCFTDITEKLEALAREREGYAREQAMETEKIASLGVVVAGVAHEINTPIGVSYTLVTYFKKKTKEFSDIFKSGAMKKSDLDKYVELADETSNQLISNVTRAADLIQSFKQIAVDQTRDDRRKFELKAYANEIMNSLSPTIRKTMHTITIDFPEPVEIESYPGAFSQIITNLTMNALTHAFTEDVPGKMVLKVRSTGSRVILTFSDNGKGISEENITKIFTPFFTTRRNTGGSGLGLSIVHNIISQKLKGTITCTSTVGVGTQFIVDVPLV